MACCNIVDVCLCVCFLHTLFSFACQYFWSSCRVCDAFFPILYLYHWLLLLCFEMVFPYIFLIALWLLLIATSQAIFRYVYNTHTHTYRNTIVPWIQWNLYFDLCMQCSTFRIHIVRNIAIDTNDTERMKAHYFGLLIILTMCVRVYVHLPTKIIIRKYVPVKLARKIFTNPSVVYSQLSPSISLSHSEHSTISFSFGPPTSNVQR